MVKRNWPYKNVGALVAAGRSVEPLKAESSVDTGKAT